MSHVKGIGDWFCITDASQHGLDREATVLERARQHVGIPDHACVRVLKQGNTATILHVRGGMELTLKLYPPNARPSPVRRLPALVGRWSLKRERRIQQAIAAVGVAVPRIIGTDDATFVATQYVGQTGHDPSPACLAESLVALQCCADAVPNAFFDRVVWHYMQRKRYRRLFRLVATRHGRRYGAVVAQAFAEAAAALARRRAFVLHGDFHRGNVLCDGRQVYMIDLDTAVVARGGVLVDIVNYASRALPGAMDYHLIGCYLHRLGSSVVARPPQDLEAELRYAMLLRYGRHLLFQTRPGDSRYAPTIEFVINTLGNRHAFRQWLYTTPLAAML